MIQQSLLDAVHRAGSELLYLFNNRHELEVRFKSTAIAAESIVTQADVLSEKILFDAIRNAYPDDSIQGEEGSRHTGSSSVWHVDPLDGTMNFTRGIPLWGVSVGRATDGVPDIGIVYFPVLGLLYTAETGSGAFCNGKRLQVSDRDLPHSLYCAGGFGAAKSHLVDAIAKRVRSTRITESSAHELALIARGDAEIYCLRNVPHDVVAGIVLVQEAGGIVTDKFGKPYTTTSSYVVATNGVVHETVLSLLASQLLKLENS